MVSWETCESVERDPGRLGGVWVFKGTRVPLRALFENVESGATVDEFVEWFEGVTKEQAVAAMECARKNRPLLNDQSL